jgi:para-nitrobenzyl esterase
LFVAAHIDPCVVLMVCFRNLERGTAMSRISLSVLACATLMGFGTREPAAAEPAPTQVIVDGGTVEGAVAGDILTFKGIPYAAPPVGALRWAPPQPVAHWDGIRQAAEYGPDCMQKPIKGDAAPLGSTLSEDCLYLNVWRPADAGSSPLPVMVWIHGGGFVNGGSSAAVFDGSAFARQGIVFVSLNYRLGRFGVFAHPALTGAAARPLGNYGYMDQLEALRWVQRNARAFGGDPGNVTVFGESAGGASVLDLIASHPNEGLYRRAIVLSGGGRKFLGGLKLLEKSPLGPSAEQLGIDFARRFRIKETGQKGLDALRGLSPVNVTGNLNMIAQFAEAVVPFLTLRYAGGPIVDGTVVKALPETIFRSGGGAKVPLIIGATGADLGVSIPLTRRGMFAEFGAESAAARTLYDPTGERPFRELRAEVEGDRTMQEPARWIARKVATDGSPAWLYRFEYVPEAERATVAGAGHASELAFVFDTVDVRYGKAVTDKDRATAKALNTYFGNFAKTGNPNGVGLPDWPQVDASHADIMTFTPDGGPSFGPDPWKDRLDLVERAAEAAAN